MNWSDIIIAVVSALGGGGIWQVVKSQVDKRKTPYDMVIDLLQEQKKFYEERNADYERESRDSAEKSSVIMQSNKCAYKYTSPKIRCPVDEANEQRLKNRCSRCGYEDLEGEKENEKKDNGAS